jgi:hypothetical protein
MIKKNILLLVSSGSLLWVSVSLAIPFNSFDPKSMAMGGAGVAVPNPGSSPFFNPALMSIAEDDDDFAIELPIIGGHLSDRDDFIDAVDNFDDSLMDRLDAAIVNYNGAPGTSGPVLTAVNDVNRGIQALSNKPVEFDVNLGLVIAIPSESFGIAFSASGSFYGGGVFNYRDGTTVTSLTTDLGTLDDCYAQVGAINQANCIQNATFNFVDTNPGSPTFGDVIFNAQSDNNTPSNILSTARFVGIGLTEVGLTLSREFYLFGSNWAIGITPKAVSVTVIDYEANADSADVNNLDVDDYTSEYDDFNMDVGIARDFDNSWRVGFVIKNIISQDYKAFRTDAVTNVRTATGTLVSLKPQARVGISHTNSWSTVTADLDLTENEAVSTLSDNTQYLAAGIEFDVFDTAQLRLGYRADLVNSDHSIASAGFGLSPFGVHIDLAVAGNSDDIGAAFQFGFRF